MIINIIKWRGCLVPVVIVGGDNLGGITKRLKELGATEVIHVTGRKARQKSAIRIPRTAAFVLVLIDYINHGSAQAVKEAAKASGIPALFARRAWSSIEEQLVAGGLVSASRSPG